MSGKVKRVPRRYDSSRRQEQAAASRWAMLSAARRRFLEDGYAATTMAMIATDAAVSVESVYKAFGNKAGLLKSVLDVAIAGDDEPVPIMQRDFVARNRAETDGRRRLTMYAEHYVSAAARSVPVMRLVRQAAGSDEAVAAVQAQMDAERRTGMGFFARDLHLSGMLRVSEREAADVLYAFISGDLYQSLVVERGWSSKRFAAWMGDRLADALLPK